LRKLLLLGLAGGVGTLARYWLSGLVQRFGRETFPTGTLCVNLLGCFFIGLVMYLARDQQALSPESRSVIVVGLLGGFTTFSAFGYETLELLQGGAPLAAGANVAANVVLGIGAVWMGTVAGRLFF
jgi:CrcB protein